MKLPSISLGPRPRSWDFVAIAGAALAVAVAVGNWIVARDAGVGTTATLGFAVAQLAIGSACLFVLGKTAKEGTIWGNLAAVGGMLLGISGVLLAGAIWVAA